MSIVLARRLYETQVPWTPMLSRYTVAAVAMAAWVVATVPVWIGNPVAPATRFGAPGATHLLGLGVIGFVVLGTIYHIVPFIVWVHHYSDRLGYEAVPMIDDLYDDRLAALDLGLFTIGGVALVVADWTTFSSLLAGVGGLSIVAGILVFGWNMGSVIRIHSPNGLAGVLVPGVSRGSSTETTSEDPR
jgi:cbb3-type cytochrome oxidase subunit 1